MQLVRVVVRVIRNLIGGLFKAELKQRGAGIMGVSGIFLVRLSANFLVMDVLLPLLILICFRDVFVSCWHAKRAYQMCASIYLADLAPGSESELN